MRTGVDNHKAAVECGFWPLYRYNPLLSQEGKNPLKLDSKEPKISFKDWAYSETRFKMLTKSKPEEAKRLLEAASVDVAARWNLYTQMADMKYGASE